MRFRSGDTDSTMVAIPKLTALQRNNDVDCSIEEKQIWAAHDAINPRSNEIRNLSICFREQPIVRRAYMRYCAWLAKEISCHFKAPHIVENDGLMVKANFSISKKKYYAELWEHDESREDSCASRKEKIQGMECTRRDIAPVVSDLVQSICTAVVSDPFRGSFLKEVFSTLHNLRNQDTPIEKLIISKELRNAMRKEEQPHSIAAEKLFKRTGLLIPDGSRSCYVRIRPNVDGKRPNDKECYNYTHANLVSGKEDIDFEYYIQTALLPVIERTLAPLMDVTQLRLLFKSQQTLDSFFKVGTKRRPNDSVTTASVTKKKSKAASIKSIGPLFVKLSSNT